MKDSKKHNVNWLLWLGLVILVHFWAIAIIAAKDAWNSRYNPPTQVSKFK